MRAFVDEHRENFGVEPICNVLQIAPSGYRKHAAQRRNRGQADALESRLFEVPNRESNRHFIPVLGSDWGGHPVKAG